MRKYNWRRFYWPSKDHLRPKLDPWMYERNQAKLHLTPQAQLKLEWIIFYNTLGNKNAKETAKHFGITRKTIHKWLKRFKEKGSKGLEEQSTAPIHLRKRQISIEQRVRVKSLRNDYPKVGKMKLVYLYHKRYGDNISSWKIQKLILRKKLK